MFPRSAGTISADARKRIKTLNNCGGGGADGDGDDEQLFSQRCGRKGAGLDHPRRAAQGDEPCGPRPCGLREGGKK